MVPNLALSTHWDGAFVASVTMQIHHGGRWRDAATIEIEHPERGIASPCALDYDVDYFADFASIDLADGIEVVDWRALSVGVAVDMRYRASPRWPAFLLDLLPQGDARRRLARELGFDSPDPPTVDHPLLLRGAGGPIGNLRVREAWEGEQARVAAEVARNGPCPGVTLDAILARADPFPWVAERFALVASGSSGVQGEWPKILMTQAADGLWYPDSVVPDADARAHVIVKLSRGKQREDAVILESEAPYLEVARAFGLRVAKPLIHAPHVLVIPRFDRLVTAEGVVRYGQESLVSALGVAEFGHMGTHERYIEVLARVATDPAGEVVEYVLRDLLNRAMGNPDNHGRNTALAKRPDGSIALTPLFDFAPMALDPSAIGRATKWACMGNLDPFPDWALICETAAADVMNPADLMAAVAETEGFLRDLPRIARRHGVPVEAIERACRFHDDMAERVAVLKRFRHGL
ncbi:MAG: type II toxin-antitoxin system HipA family toxin [Alphaproteobacteria bacterium]|nr:type II toxin-antitoxin system HipA family toxin [Alphaproteobacteria bacterium]